MTFRDWFFNKLPAYFKTNDSYKDVNGEGLLERYLRIYGLEIDEEIIPKIENYLDTIDPLICDEKFLNLIAYQLGNPPDFFGNTSLYRKFLSVIVEIYKIKGTRKSYLLLFALLGYNVDLIMFYPRDIIYDNGEIYDDEEPILYDDVCGTCVPYMILFYAADTNCQRPQDYYIPEISPDIWQLFRRVACFLEPINAKLIGLVPALPLCEGLSLSLSEEVTIEVQDQMLYDDGHEYDADPEEVYDLALNNTITINWP